MRALIELRDPWAVAIAALAAMGAVGLAAPWQVAVGAALAVLIVRVAAGMLVATPPRTQTVPPPVSTLPGRADYGGGPGGALTRREAEVAELVSQGLRNRDIAEKLVIEVDTVENHVQHILQKLDFHSRAQIAAWQAERRMSIKK